MKRYLVNNINGYLVKNINGYLLVNLPDVTGSQNTPLHAAASKSQILAFSCLLYHGASQEATNNKVRSQLIDYSYRAY